MGFAGDFAAGVDEVGIADFLIDFAETPADFFGGGVHYGVDGIKVAGEDDFVSEDFSGLFDIHHPVAVDDIDI